MFNQNAYDLFVADDVLDVLAYLPNDTDLFILPEDDVRAGISPNFNLHIDEEVLLLRDTSFWNSKDQGCVVSDWGISVIVDNNNGELQQFSWGKIHHVEYKNQQLQLFLSDDRNDNIPIHISYFVKDSEDYKDFGSYFAELFSLMAETDSEMTFTDKVDYFWEQYQNNNIEEATSVADEFVSSEDNKDMGYYYKSCINTLKSSQLREQADNEEAEEEKKAKYKEAIALEEEANMYCDLALEIAEGEDWRSTIFQQKAICVGLARARNYYIAAMESEKYFLDVLKSFQSSTDNLLSLYNEHLESDEYWREQLQEPDMSAEEIQEFRETCVDTSFVNFSKKNNLPHSIFIAQDDRHLKGCYDPTCNIFHVFTLAKRPKELKFPLGHPVANTLYIPHPYDECFYLPYESAEKTLFMDKIREFCYLVQCLGATKISFTSLKGEKITSDINSDINIEGNADFKIHSLNSESSKTVNSHFDNHKKDSVDLVQEFHPTQKPFLPEKLAWYIHETSWQQLVRQRLDGNMLHYELRIASQETVNMSGNQKHALNASYKNFLMGVNANYNMSLNENISTYEESEWKISVDFMSKDQIQTDSTTCNQDHFNQVSAAEQEYVDEYKEMIADGEISERDRRFLDKIKKSNGISDARALELEQSCIINLSPEEQEYVDEYKEIIAEGNISDRDRRYLDKIMKMNGITEARARELENLV